MEGNMRLCDRCDFQNPPEAAYCGRCGQRLGGDQIGSFSVGLLILLHYITFGIFSIIWLNLYHGKLPRRRSNDPTVGRAVGFLFIPFYNLYWVFFTHLRLCERLNEERRLVGLTQDAPHRLALWCCIIRVIPYVGVLDYLITYPILAGILQASFNEFGGAWAQSPGSQADAPGAACPTCGATNPSDAVFCRSCGARIGAGEAGPSS